nr:uncharacterized protein LOC109159006 [Ipomoea batatas]
MANPRRTSFSTAVNHHQLPISTVSGGSQAPATLLTSAKSFLKKPHAFPFLLSLFLLLTWVSLRLQRPSSHFPHSGGSESGSELGRRADWSPDDDHFANLARFSASSSLIAKDKRGWLLNPIALALDAHISGGATSCASVHLGEIKPGGTRGNHRHHTCNETFVFWGSKMIFRLENNALKKGYAEVKLGADEVAVAASPSGTAHALVNIDPVRSTFFLGCQDNVVNYSDSKTDFNIWKDL